MRTIEGVLDRIHAEYLEMPGLRLTLEQAQRLCGVERALCQRVLDRLVDMKFLCIKANGAYARVTEGADHARPHQVKADLRADRDAQDAKEFAQDCHVLWTIRPNVLVTGPADAVEQALAMLLPRFDPPVCYWTLAALLPSPRDVRTLVIRRVDALSVEQQRDLSSWFEQAAVAGTQVVSTTTVPLFQRVAAGLFLDALYYRLNTSVLYAGLTDGADHPDLRLAKVSLGTDVRSQRAS